MILVVAAALETQTHTLLAEAVAVRAAKILRVRQSAEHVRHVVAAGVHKAGLVVLVAALAGRRRAPPWKEGGKGSQSLRSRISTISFSMRFNTPVFRLRGRVGVDTQRGNKVMRLAERFDLLAVGIDRGAAKARDGE